MKVLIVNEIALQILMVINVVIQTIFWSFGLVLMGDVLGSWLTGVLAILSILTAALVGANSYTVKEEK